MLGQKYFFYIRLGQVRQVRLEIRYFSVLDQVRLGQVRLEIKYVLYQIRLGQVRLGQKYLKWSLQACKHKKNDHFYFHLFFREFSRPRSNTYGGEVSGGTIQQKFHPGKPNLTCHMELGLPHIISGILQILFYISTLTQANLTCHMELGQPHIISGILQIGFWASRTIGGSPYKSHFFFLRFLGLYLKVLYSAIGRKGSPPGACGGLVYISNLTWPNLTCHMEIHVNICDLSKLD